MGYAWVLLEVLWATVFRGLFIPYMVNLFSLLLLMLTHRNPTNFNFFSSSVSTQ